MSTVASKVKKAVKSLTPVQPSSTAKTSDAMLKEFFIDALQDIYWAENHLVKALQIMRQAASSSTLQKAFETHLEQTRTHSERLEEVFTQLGRAAKGKKCEAMEGLIAEANTIIDETERDTATRDVGLILAAQKVEHYEIATYGSLAQLARTLGYDGIAEILGGILQEEKQTDLLLTEIAENSVNYEALSDIEE